MKLYVSPGACSLSPHIVFREAGLNVEVEDVSLASKKTKSGDDFKAINPKGKVPTLRLDDGRVLTEGAAIVQYLADLAPASNLAPKAGTFERVRVQEWLNYVASEVHKGFSPLFYPTTPEQTKQTTIANLSRAFDFLSTSLAEGPFLLGSTFTVADAYLYTILLWTKHFGGDLDLAKWPVLQGYVARITERPAVRATLDFEAELKKAGAAKS
ncbi:glutathione transferase GstA [Pendulispora rubella]|uniref:Glutathione transferase GstA n=1 Tax=Pendulispora rubella TaxID=2741070 RepID=A0ABZ2L0D0_9BACT